MKKKVTVLHVHSNHSVCDGVATHEEYAQKIKDINSSSSKYEITSIGITEHGCLYGQYTARNIYDKNKINHLMGYEAYVCTDEDLKRYQYNKENGIKAQRKNNMTEEEAKEYRLLVKELGDPRLNFRKRYHLCLYPVGNKGKEAIIKLASRAGQNVVKPSKKYHITTENLLREYGKDLIGTSACLGGVIASAILNEDFEYAKKKILEYNSYFYKFYLEVQPHDTVKQKKLNRHLVMFAKELNIPLVVGFDAHFINKQDKVLYTAVQSLAGFEREPDMEDGIYYEYLRTFEEIEEYLIKNDIPLSAIDSTTEIGELATAEIFPKNKKELMPRFPIPDGYTLESYFRKEVNESFLENINKHNFTNVKERVARMNHELEVICNSKYAGYFLIVKDWTRALREKNIIVGPGRGCFLPFSKVRLSSGQSKNIENIKIGDSVITHKGNTKKVINKFEYKVSEPMTVINSEQGEIFCTRDHKILTKDGFKAAYLLKEGDLLAIPKHRISFTGKSQIDAKYILEQDHRYSYESEYIFNTKNQKIRRYIDLDFNLGFCVGAFLNCGKTSCTKTIFSFKKGFIDSSIIKETIRKYSDCKIFEKDFGNKTKITINSLLFLRVFSYIIDVRTYNIKEDLLHSNEEFLKGIVSGFYYKIHSTKNQDTVLSSRETANSYEQLSYILNHFNIYSSVEITKNKKIIKIKKKHRKYFSYIMGFDPIETLESNIVEDYSYFYTPVKGKSKRIYFGKVYDLEVEEDHTYTINTIAVHNSAASSLCNYMLNITNVDPLKNGFIFSRFLNAERIDLPDIDTDVPTEKRAESIKYLEEKYGREKTAHIITFNYWGIKSLVQEAGKLMGMAAQDVINISTNLPNLPFDKIKKIYQDPTSDMEMSDMDKNKCVRAYEELEKLITDYPELEVYFSRLNNTIKSTGQHASAVVISDKDLFGIVGTETSTSEKAILPMLQICMSEADSLGLLKLDVLGLSSLTVIKNTMDLAGLDWNFYDNQNYDDLNVLNFLYTGHTDDVFQLAKYTPTKLLRDYKCNDIVIISAVNASNRPGPLKIIHALGKSMIDLFIDGASGNLFDWGDDRVNKYLDNTKRSILYQEQCQKLGEIMAGYTLGMADIRIRKTIGKFFCLGK